jgi:F-box domain
MLEAELTIDDLPNEILDLALGELGPVDLLLARGTCRLWREICGKRIRARGKPPSWQIYGPDQFRSHLRIRFEARSFTKVVEKFLILGREEGVDARAHKVDEFIDFCDEFGGPDACEIDVDWKFILHLAARWGDDLHDKIRALLIKQTSWLSGEYFSVFAQSRTMSPKNLSRAVGRHGDRGMWWFFKDRGLREELVIGTAIDHGNISLVENCFMVDCDNKLWHLELILTRAITAKQYDLANKCRRLIRKNYGEQWLIDRGEWFDAVRSLEFWDWIDQTFDYQKNRDLSTIKRVHEIIADRLGRGEGED